VFLLVVLLGGYSWFSNFRIYNRDLESIRQQIRLDIQQEVATLHSAAAKEREVSRQKLADEVEHLRTIFSQQLTALRTLLEEAEGRRNTSEEYLKNLPKEQHHLPLKPLDADSTFYVTRLRACNPTFLNRRKIHTDCSIR